MSVKAAAPAALIGLGAGLMAGLLGVGGGMIMTIGLVTACRLSQHRAHATSLAAIVPVAAVGALVFALDGKTGYGTAALLTAGALAGAPLGAWVMSRLDEARLKAVFGLLMLVVAVQLVLR